MSVIVAKKEENRVIMACDTQVTHGQTKGSVTKIFKNKKNDNIICGVVGSLRDLNLLSSMEDLIDDFSIRRDLVDTDSIITNTIPKIKEFFKKEGRIVSTEDGDIMHSSFIISYKNSIWTIGGDFSVKEVDDFVAIGSPEEFAMGVYEAIKDDNTSIEDKIVKIIDICIKKTIYVDYPIYMIDTEKKEFKEIKK